MASRRTILRSLLLALPLALLAGSPVAAGDFRGSQTVTVAEGETVTDDLYVGAGTVQIAGTVEGDATIAGGTVTITGTVDGSLNVAAGTVDVVGDVGGAVRVSGGNVRIAGSVGRDVVVFGGTATIDSNATVSGDVAGGVGTLTVNGAVGGDILAGAGDIMVNGSVDGNLDVSVTNLTLGSTAVVGGDVNYRSSRDAAIDDGAQVGGDVTRSEPPPNVGTSALPDNPIVTFIGLLVGLLLLGWPLLALRPRFVLGTAEAVRLSPLPSFGLGLAGWIGQFLLLILLFICAVLFGILAGPIGGAFFAVFVIVLMLVVIVALVAAVPVAMAVGELVLRDQSPYLGYLAGAALLALVLVLLSLLPVLGGIATLVVWIMGLGAFILYFARTRQVPWTRTGQPPPLPPAPEPVAPAPAA
ncbi:MAG TPA: polymer-forming cytoskeletal protein [Candidatus Limnocylindria bacterium]|nr:polymer-forming cytoskeletal protein [Candidatus Limnocylindria bacterium]